LGKKKKDLEVLMERIIARHVKFGYIGPWMGYRLPVGTPLAAFFEGFLRSTLYHCVIWITQDTA
jgi:hypothetical protein